jgi:phosphonate transport system permease protein
VAALAAWHVWPSGGLELTKGWGALGRMLGALATPDLSAASLGKALASTAIPLSMAFLGTLLGALAAGVIALPASSSFQMRSADFTGEAGSFFTSVARALVLLAARGAALVARAVPEVLWAMLLVSAFRLGTLPGMLALAIHSTGLLARLFTESVDGVSLSTLEVTYGSSGSRAKTFLYGAVPSVAQEWLANAFLQFESNVRAAIVLGIVGVGGLGFLFSFEFEFFRYQRAGTYLLLMVALAISLDRLSRSLGWVRVRTQ